ncbi:MAG TPA: hypothetical protein VNC17_11910 [Thermoleophilaceae bacterium]|nr:hypothetical protein [Thermoleophilaceae bacterium]
MPCALVALLGLLHHSTVRAARDPAGTFGVFVHTDQSPPGVTRDPDERTRRWRGRGGKSSARRRCR